MNKRKWDYFYYEASSPRKVFAGTINICREDKRLISETIKEFIIETDKETDEDKVRKEDIQITICMKWEN